METNQNSPLPQADSMSVEVTLNSDHQRIIKRVFGDQNIKDTAAELAQLAIEEWLDWIDGSRRYSSDTDQSIDRIISIYGEIMPDVEPEISFLYNRFNIPYGRSKYIVQAIINRQLHSLNLRANERLLKTLEAEWNDYQEMDPEDRKVLQEIRFVIDLREEKLLTTIIEQMPLSKRPIASFKRQPIVLPNTREYSLAPRDLENVLNAVRDFQI